MRRDPALARASTGNGSPPIVRWLLERGAAVDARGRMGRTPLHLAAEHNLSPEVAKILIEHGARLDAVDDAGMTPLDVAVKHQKAVVAHWLRASAF